MFYRVGIRNARLGVACVLVLGYTFVSAASARDDASSAPAGKKTAASSKANHRSSTSTTKSKPHRTSAKHKTKKVRGQQKIDGERAQAIQEALIRAHYLNGEATGTWNQASEDAMRKFQADNGWQSKTVPDSRALIKLGLGPSKDHLLNPESAMTTVPDSPRAEPVPTNSHSAPPAANTASPAVPTSTPASTDSSSPQ
jgi:Putative peptidoglycan binding domain